MSNDNAPTHLTNLKDARSRIGKLDRRVAELEAANAALRHDLERSMANHVADLNVVPQRGQ